MANCEFLCQRGVMYHDQDGSVSGRSVPSPYVSVLLLFLLGTGSTFGQLCPPRIGLQQERPEFTSIYAGPNSYRLTSDGGYIVAGTGYGISSERSSPVYGGADFILFRLDSNLEKVWDQSFGGG